MNILSRHVTINKMSFNLVTFRLLFFTFFSIFSSQVIAAEWSGNISAESRIFKNEAQSDIQKKYYQSVAIRPKFHTGWDNDRQSLDVELFGRLNDEDNHRDAFDIRELSWTLSESEWELRLGIRKVFWGVTESQHLVDIINQTDFSERVDGEEKLGQPMINIALIKDWGTVDLFVMPYFRERKYPGSRARLGFPLPIAEDSARYQSSAEEQQIDTAVRWSHYIGDWDIGISHFYGNSREPLLSIDNVNGKTVFVPYYKLINQTGLDLQATLENWLWKLEAIYRSSESNDFFASTFGLEYSFFDIAASGVDIGLVVEYSYDDQGEKATTPFEDDTLFAVRLALNDEQSTDALVGAIVDNDGNGTALSLEANRRIGQDWKLTVNGYLYTNTDPKDLIDFYANEDFIQFELGYYY